MKKTQTKAFSNLVISVILLAFEIWAYIQTLDFKVVKKAAVQPATFPQVMCIGMMLFTIILLISGLQNIDDHYYTVAKVDGARAKRIFFRITVPLLSPTIGLVLIINSISAFKVFNSVVVLFSGYPGPMYNMYTMTYYIYEQIKTNMEYGRAAAASLILFLFIFLFTMLQRFIQRKWKYD